MEMDFTVKKLTQRFQFHRFVLKTKITEIKRLVVMVVYKHVIHKKGKRVILKREL